MTTPVPPSGNPTPDSTNAASSATPNAFLNGANTDDPWYAYAQQMFPNQEITPEIIAGLKKNMMTMINTTMSQINASHAAANEYNQKVARGEE